MKKNREIGCVLSDVKYAEISQKIHKLFYTFLEDEAKKAGTYPEIDICVDAEKIITVFVCPLLLSLNLGRTDEQLDIIIADIIHVIKKHHKRLHMDSRVSEGVNLQ
jgi:hypothetical protein